MRPRLTTSERRGLTVLEKEKILETAERYVAAEKGSPDAYALHELMAYVAQLRRNRLNLRKEKGRE